MAFEMPDWVLQLELADVHPRKIGGLMLVEADFRNVFLDKRLDEVAIASKIGAKFVEPWPAVAVRGVEQGRARAVAASQSAQFTRRVGQKSAASR